MKIYKPLFIKEEYEPLMKGSYLKFNQLIKLHNDIDSFFDEYWQDVKNNDKIFFETVKRIKNLIQFTEKNYNNFIEELDIRTGKDYTNWIERAKEQLKKAVKDKSVMFLDTSYASIHNFIKQIKDEEGEV